MYKFLSIFGWLCMLIFSGNVMAQDIGQNYIEKWKAFYPSKALAQGIHASIYHYEDFSPTKIEAWVEVNKNLIKNLNEKKNSYSINHHIDAALLLNQAQSELEIWRHNQPHKHQLSFYSRLISKAASSAMEADFLNLSERNQIICQRMEKVRNLTESAKLSLKHIEKDDAESALNSLNRAKEYYEDALPNMAVSWRFPASCANFTQECSLTALSIQSLINHVNQELLPKAKEESPILGKKEYNRRLHLYTHSSVRAEEMGKMAYEEIQLVRKLIGEVSTEYVTKQYPDQPIPATYEEIVKIAFDDMEKDAPKNGEEYLQFWQELADNAVAFIEEEEIATLPKFQTLRIIPAPESAGPAARIGWVESAPSFDPNPLTTLYLPSIPETMPEQERIDFWSSFNKPFNRMIVIHELFPGHYMQIKISRATAHPARLLFPFEPYFEGWATFTERVCLDKGWEKERPLTMLAHLRKRLENANRAYTSVQVHCHGWDQEKVMKFSTETSLLAPQFAKSLWGRLMRSPMQLTSYFWGGKQFTALMKSEKERLGDRFVLKDFMDTVMKAGPIPMNMFDEVFGAGR